MEEKLDEAREEAEGLKEEQREQEEQEEQEEETAPREGEGSGIPEIHIEIGKPKEN